MHVPWGSLGLNFRICAKWELSQYSIHRFNLRELRDTCLGCPKTIDKEKMLLQGLSLSEQSLYGFSDLSDSKMSNLAGNALFSSNTVLAHHYIKNCLRQVKAAGRQNTGGSRAPRTRTYCLGGTYIT